MAVASVGRLCSWFGVLLAATLLSACGGGANPSFQLLSGTVNVDGASLAKATVSVRCADGSLFHSTTNESGVWQLVMSNPTLPCALQASAGTLRGVANLTPYHSIAVSFGVNNITPLSDLMVARLTGVNPPVWFASPALAGVNAAAMHAALATVSTALGMGPAISTFDPLTVGDIDHPFSNVLIAMRATLDDAAVHKTEAELLQAALSGDFSGFAVFAALFPAAFAVANGP